MVFAPPFKGIKGFRAREARAYGPSALTLEAKFDIVIF